MNRFQRALKHVNEGTPPIWFMRQAGRYHAHYQGMKEKHSFIELCKIPEAACETTMGPIRDFDFDAAILFSDLLFPLEAMGMPLQYAPGPKLDWHLEKKADLSRLRGGAELARELDFQAQALKLIRAELSPEKGLLGFVGGPLTLFFYAAAGSHQGNSLDGAREGMRDGRFEGFCEKLEDLLAENMALQARSRPDTVAMLDTCAGEVSPEVYARQVVPAISRVLAKFHAKCPGFPVVYYSKGTDERYWRSVAELPIACLGVDWNVDLARTLREWGGRFGIQGNIDPNWLFLDWPTLESRVRPILEEALRVPAAQRSGWIFGLGHGVLPKTPESNVRGLVRLAREVLR